MCEQLLKKYHRLTAGVVNQTHDLMITRQASIAAQTTEFVRWLIMKVRILTIASGTSLINQLMI